MIIASVSNKPVIVMAVFKYRVARENPDKNATAPATMKIMYIGTFTSSSGRSLDLQLLHMILDGVEADKKVPIVIFDLHMGQDVSNFILSLPLDNRLFSN